MKYETVFNLRQKVKVKELNLIGRICGFYINSAGEIEYKVRTFKDNLATELFFFQDELEPTEENKKLPFKN